MSDDEKTIGIFGGYDALPDSPLYRLAYQVGHELARAGFVVLNGGYDGIMAASSKGARDADGRTIGVTCPTVLIKRGSDFTHNEFLDEVVEAPDLFARIEIMMYRCGGYVFMRGGTGTLSELGLIWEYVNKGFIRPRPVVLVGDFWRPTVEAIASARPGAGRHVHFCQTAAEVAATMQAYAVAPEPRSSQKRR
jgi:uncharacterized protein (TIGR00725 family)